MRTTPQGWRIAAACWLACWSAVAWSAESMPWFDDFRAARQRAKEADRTLMAFFHMPGSAECERMARETLDLSAVRAALDSFVKARVNAAQEREFALYYRVQAYPTIVFFDSQGRELDRFTGYIDPPMFLKLALEAVDPKTNYVALKERLRANPGDVEALYYMGYKYARRGEDDRAEGYFARVEELDAKNEFGFHDNIALRRAERLANGEDPAQALAALERLRAKYPDADERERADLLWARTLWRAGRSQDALQAYSAFLQQYPQSDQRGQVEAALAALQAGAL